MLHRRLIAPSAFSLVELLVVLAVISVISAGMVPLINSLSMAGNLTKSASDISSILEQARAYAMGKDTYVYVGMQEVDAVNPNPVNGTGRLVVAVVTSLDGARPYTTGSLAAADIAAISKPQYFNAAHLTSASSLVNGSTMKGRPAASVDLSAATATTAFSWPLTGTPEYNFTKVIEFDPQGVARVQASGAYNASIQACIEIPLIPAHGNIAAASVNNQAAVQIDGVTGAVRIYRP